MASIADVCWERAQDLFMELDLDTLYLRQVTAIGMTQHPSYPYQLLVHTGKITIGINLGPGTSHQEHQLGVARGGNES